MDDQRLRPTERLRHPHEYQRVFQQGEKLVGPLFILYILPTSASCSRLGLAVSKRLGNAVARNRVKRCLREVFRHHKAWLAPACDVVCVARQGGIGMAGTVYTQQYRALLQRCKCLKPQACKQQE